MIEQLHGEVEKVNQLVLEQDSRIELLEQKLENFQFLGSDSGNINSQITKTGTPDLASIGVIQEAEKTHTQKLSTDSLSFNLDNVELRPWQIAALVLVFFIILLSLLISINRLLVGRAVEFLTGGRIEYDDDSPSFFYAFSKKPRLRSKIKMRDERSELSEENDFEEEYRESEHKREDFDDDSFLVHGEYESHVEELSFPERINQLIDEGEFEEAKKVLKFASKMDFDEGYLNLCLLKIFMAQSNNEQFTKLFEEIKEDIDNYSSDIQLQISELKAEMAVEDIIEYSQEKLI